MTQITTRGGIAPLSNVMLAHDALETAINRPIHLPGMVTLSGPSGLGKTYACTYAANKFKAYYVECKSTWTKKAVLEAILKEMGVNPKTQTYKMTEQISEELVLSGRPLIIDEMDHIVEKKSVEIIRDIYEGSKAPILMIGEENMPSKLKKWERFDGRISQSILAVEPSLDDAAILRQNYCHLAHIEDDLLTHIHKSAKGSVRRICVNLELAQQHAINQGLESINLQQIQGLTLSTGQPPRRTRA